MSRPSRRPARAARRVIIEARAKLNLGLAVGPHRPDGYHEIATLFQSISLADTLIAETRPRGFSLRVRHEHAAARGRARRLAVPGGSGNLVLRAARALRREAQWRDGARFTLIKRIPSRAGLGGGSADAAAALVALSRLHGGTRDPGAIGRIAAGLGADVAFALSGGTALGRGRGELLSPVASAPFRAVVAVPAWAVSTPAAYARLERVKYGLTRWRAHLRFAERIGRTRVTVASALKLGNTFEHVLGERRADFDALCRRLTAAGLKQPHLTGSGSAVFAIVAPGVRVNQVVDRFEGSETLYVVRSVPRGLRLMRQARTG